MYILSYVPGVAVGAGNIAVNAAVQNVSPHGAPCYGEKDSSKGRESQGKGWYNFKKVHQRKLKLEGDISRNLKEEGAKLRSEITFQVEGRVKCEG